MRNLVLHLQTQCLFTATSKRAQEILWEEFYTKAIYSSECPLIADSYDLGQRCMAAFDRGDTYRSRVNHGPLPGDIHLLILSWTRPFCRAQMLKHIGR